MATELEKAVKKLNQALSQASETERTEFLEQNFQPDHFELTAKAPVSIWKKFVSRAGQLLATAGLIVLRLMIWILKAPFFIFSFLKNWFFMGLGLWLICWFFDLVYRVIVLNQYWTSQGAIPTSINDAITTIIVAIAGVLSLIGTIWQYQGKID